jgi:hypothetical protein
MRKIIDDCLFYSIVVLFLGMRQIYGSNNIVRLINKLINKRYEKKHGHKILF